MTSAWAVIAAKDLRVLARDHAALFWLVGFPLVFALFFGSVLKTDGGLETAPQTVVLVEEGDSSAAAGELAGFLEQAGFRIERAAEAVAAERVRRGEALAFAALDGGDEGAVWLGIDPSRRAEAALLESLVGSVPQARRPVRVTSVALSRAARSGYEIVFPAMVLWGLLGCAAGFAISMVAERASGALVRLRAAPIERASILGGKAAACATACTLDALLLGGVGWGLLGVQIADAAKLGAAVAALVVCFTGLTMLLSVLGKTEHAVAGTGWAALILMAMLGGAMVPVSRFPRWLLPASRFSPVSWAIFALEGATWRGFGWTELAHPLAVLATVGIVGFASGVALLALQREV